MSACSVAKCCSASVSVGAMKTACMSCSTARSIACSATTVLPEPTSPISRRCIGRGWASSSSRTAIAAQLVAGQRERQQLLAPAPASATAARRAPARCRPRGAGRGGAAARAGRAAARRTPAGGGRPRDRRCARRRGPPGGRGTARRARSARRQRLDDVLGGGQVLAHEREDLRRRQALRRRVVRDLALAAGLLIGRRVARDAKRVARARTCRAGPGACRAGTCAAARAG